MNILFLVPYDFEMVGGLSLPIKNYKRNLEGYGHNIFYFKLKYHMHANQMREISTSIVNEIENHSIECIISFTLNQSYMLAKQIDLNGYKGRKIAFLMDRV